LNSFPFILLPPNRLAPDKSGCGADNFQYAPNRRSPVNVIPLCGISISIVHAEKVIIKTKTYVRHDFCSELLADSLQNIQNLCAPCLTYPVGNRQLVERFM
jgi:hypothetical protein